MRILYDHQAFQQVLGGVSRYYVETIKHLSQDIEREIAIKFSRNLYIKELLPEIISPFGSCYIPFKRRMIRELNLKYAISRLKNSNYDIFHATFDDSYFLPHVKTPFVITVHDLIPESEPQKWPTGWLECRKSVFPKANHIICNSFNTKNDLLHYYPYLDISRISVVYHGYKVIDSKLIDKISSQYYILFVGGRKGYKNFERFAEACAPILHGNKDMKLVCTGEVFSKEEVQLLVKLKIQNKVIHKKVSDNELRRLYKNALLFVFPSLKEGFGLPILEAWGNECPFLEIAEGAANYFDPHSIEDMRRSINDILYNSNLRKNLIEKGKERIKLFNWEYSSREHEQIYKKIITESN